MPKIRCRYYNDKKTADLMRIDDEERPCAIQIFGSDADIMAEVIPKVMAVKPDIIDINMGCPTPKIVNNGDGSALLKTPEKIGEIVHKVSSASPVPVTVKIRKGWDDDSINAVEVAKIIEQGGAAAIAIHGRTRAEFYSGTADWDIIKKVKESVSIPVIGNGDVTDVQSAALLLEQTGCDAIMIGRGAMGNPWLFRQINAYLTDTRVLPEPGIHERMAVMLRHIDRTIQYKGERTAMMEARHHAAYYTKGLRGGAGVRRRICQMSHFEELAKLAAEIAKENAE